jgi:hypothetical protein
VADSREENDSDRQQIILRTTLLFGEERAIANRDAIDAAANAIQRIKRLKPESFKSLRPESRS